VGLKFNNNRGLREEREEEDGTEKSWFKMLGSFEGTGEGRGEEEE
jgi:hypothetical protein